MNQPVMTSDEVIIIMNNLIELNRDGQNGFQEAAAKLSAPRLKAFCQAQSLNRAKFVGELQSEVRSLGEEPDNKGSVVGALHRGWIDLKVALGGGDHAILVATEAGEDHALRTYQKALDQTLPAALRECLVLQQKSVKLAHDEVRALRDGLDK